MHGFLEFKCQNFGVRDKRKVSFGSKSIDWWLATWLVGKLTDWESGRMHREELSM